MSTNHNSIPLILLLATDNIRTPRTADRRGNSNVKTNLILLLKNVPNWTMSSRKTHVLKIISLEDMINEQESMHQYGINNKL
jgi:hypothetical protein